MSREPVKLSPEGGPRPATMAQVPRKVMLCVSVDWFALSHFKPLIALLADLSDDVMIVAQNTGYSGDIEALGARVINFDYRRAQMNPRTELATARRLSTILREEQPDALHLIAMKPIVLGCLANWRNSVPACVVHMTGLGHLAIARTTKARLARRAALAIVARALKQPTSHLLVENPDDLAFLEAHGVAAPGRNTILGGAGVDPEYYAPTAAPDNQPPVAACVGRMIRSKGLDVLMAAQDLLTRRGQRLRLDLYGRIDDGNPEGIPKATLAQWTRHRDVFWHGHQEDIAAIWAGADIAVHPARSREGMPRALLEAASCGKPLIVTDVPGCRHFVRDGVEGLVVPPNDPEALADALWRLASDRPMRQAMGAAARARVLGGFTEAHVTRAYAELYRRLLNE